MNRRTTALVIAAGAPIAMCAAQSTPVLTRAPIIIRPTDHDAQRPAGVIYEQVTDGSNGLKSQEYTDFPSFNTYIFDDFVLARDAHLRRSFVPGVERGNSAANEVCVAQVWIGLPDRGGTLVVESRNNGKTEDLTHEFDYVPLKAGVTYHFSAWVRRSFGIGGSWFWAATETVRGQEAQFWNPGGGFGFGSRSQNCSDIMGRKYDAAFRLEEDGPPPPPPPPECYADCTGDGLLDIRDFFCFQAEFGRQSQYADCDGNSRHDVRDFFCFQAAFAEGCR